MSKYPEVFAGKSKMMVNLLVGMAIDGDPREGFCATCGGEIDPEEFRDELSRREWTISGMCQKCQDEVFD